MYDVKFTKGTPGKAGYREWSLESPCTHYAAEIHEEPVTIGRSYLDPDDAGFEVEAGIMLEFAPSGDRVHLPTHADAAFIMNERGANAAVYRWPIHREAKERKSA